MDSVRQYGNCIDNEKPPLYHPDFDQSIFPCMFITNYPFMEGNDI